MNLRDYFHEINAQEVAIEDEFVFVISLKTETGGRAGVVSQVSRSTAAKMIVERAARLASPEETEAIHEERREEQRQKELASLQERVRMAVLAEDELHTLKQALLEAQKVL
jgi:hypothetical protein